MIPVKEKKKYRQTVFLCVLLGIMLVVCMTGCKKEEKKETNTVAEVEISTATEESGELDQVDLAVYEKMDKEEQEEVLALYLTQLYKIEETSLPEGEEYEEVLLALKPALESVMRNYPNRTMQELLEQAKEMKENPEGNSIEEFFAQNIAENLTEK